MKKFTRNFLLVELGLLAFSLIMQINHFYYPSPFRNIIGTVTLLGGAAVGFLILNWLILTLGTTEK
jgi:uncharacterized membrane protein